MRRLVCVLAAVCAVAGLASSASAVPITFIHSGVGSGSLNGVSFSSTPFTIIATGDTANRNVPFGPGTFGIPHDTVVINIAGVGTVGVLDSTHTFVNQNVGGVGFGIVPFGDLFDGPFNPAFTAWDMTSSLGPVSGNGALMQWGTGVQTTNGLLAFDDDFDFDFSLWDVPTTFEAVVAGAAPIPAPGAALLVVLGAALTARLRRRGSI